MKINVRFPHVIPRTQMLDQEEEGRTNFLVEEDFLFYINDLLHVVPKGFITDFASIPRAFWPLFNPIDPQYVAGALAHDFLYSSEIYTKQIDDLVFKSALEFNRVEQWRVWCMYNAVNWFGKKSRDGKKVVLARTLLGISDVTTRPLYKTIHYDNQVVKSA